MMEFQIPPNVTPTSSKRISDSVIHLPSRPPVPGSERSQQTSKALVTPCAGGGGGGNYLRAGRAALTGCGRKDRESGTQQHLDAEQHPDLRKTRMCPNLGAKQGCPYSAEECRFAHSAAELRFSFDKYYKVLPCAFFERGKCRNGGYCRFAHGEGELRNRKGDKGVLASESGSVSSSSSSSSSSSASSSSSTSSSLSCETAASMQKRLPPDFVAYGSTDCGAGFLMVMDNSTSAGSVLSESTFSNDSKVFASVGRQMDDWQHRSAIDEGLCKTVPEKLRGLSEDNEGVCEEEDKSAEDDKIALPSRQARDAPARHKNAVCVISPTNLCINMTSQEILGGIVTAVTSGYST